MPQLGHKCVSIARARSFAHPLAPAGRRAHRPATATSPTESAESHLLARTLPLRRPNSCACACCAKCRTTCDGSDGYATPVDIRHRLSCISNRKPHDESCWHEKVRPTRNRRAGRTRANQCPRSSAGDRAPGLALPSSCAKCRTTCDRSDECTTPVDIRHK